jgi:uncharacterized protein YjbJ (UPF0337 family)
MSCADPILQPHRPINPARRSPTPTRGQIAGEHRSRTGVDLASSLFRAEKVTMDKDRIDGAAKQMKGAVKEGVGKAVGDAKLQGEGKADKAAGQVQNAVGGVKDALKE